MQHLQELSGDADLGDGSGLLEGIGGIAAAGSYFAALPVLRRVRRERRDRRGSAGAEGRGGPNDAAG